MGTGPSKSPAAVGADLELRDIRKSFGGVLVVDDVSLAVAPGELISILGPSGAARPRRFASSPDLSNRMRGAFCCRIPT